MSQVIDHPSDTKRNRILRKSKFIKGIRIRKVLISVPKKMNIYELDLV